MVKLTKDQAFGVLGVEVRRSLSLRELHATLTTP